MDDIHIILYGDFREDLWGVGFEMFEAWEVSSKGFRTDMLYVLDCFGWVLTIEKVAELTDLHNRANWEPFRTSQVHPQES